MINDEQLYYNTIIKKQNEIYRTIYSDMNRYFEHIFLLPSTINRIITYYHIAIQDGDFIHRYIMFQGHIVREYEIKLKLNEEMI